MIYTFMSCIIKSIRYIYIHELYNQINNIYTFMIYINVIIEVYIYIHELYNRIGKMSDVSKCKSIRYIIRIDYFFYCLNRNDDFKIH